MGAYEDTLKDIKNTWGLVPNFMKAFPRVLLINGWSSWKNDSLGEIDMERASYLLNIDDMLEEMLS